MKPIQFENSFVFQGGKFLDVFKKEEIKRVAVRTAYGRVHVWKRGKDGSGSSEMCLDLNLVIKGLEGKVRLTPDQIGRAHV